MIDFLLKVGDKIRLPRWDDGIFITVTAIGRSSLFGISGVSEFEASYPLAGHWRLYIESVKQHRWETVTEWRAPKAGETYLEYGQSPLSVDAKYIVAFGDWASNLCRNVIVSCREVTE